MAHPAALEAGPSTSEGLRFGARADEFWHREGPILLVLCIRPPVLVPPGMRSQFQARPTRRTLKVRRPSSSESGPRGSRSHCTARTDEHGMFLRNKAKGVRTITLVLATSAGGHPWSCHPSDDQTLGRHFQLPFVPLSRSVPEISSELQFMGSRNRRDSRSTSVCSQARMS